ncbi:MAG: tetratricopeptide repeat protein [Candidatus Hydrogenedentes bacterium]|nr:tetratricopeptide repeat protein [Candidatus Hydrogenedentota bacterium]
MLYATPQGWRALGVGLAGAIVIGIVMVGCQSTASKSDFDRPNHRGLTGPTTGTESGAGSVEQARKSIEAGDTSNVIPRLMHVIGNAPTSQPALDARYWLAVAYAKIGSYRDAIDMYGEYLQMAPEGRYADAAQTQREALETEYKAKFQTPEELDEEVGKLSGQLQKDPNNVQLQIQMANTLWKRGDYDRAAKIYYQVIGANPALANEPDLKDRIESLPNGEIIVLTPAEIQRREVERQPLVVFNTAAFRSGKDLFTREPLYFAVTGQVVNQSKSVLYGVQVVVTIYGFGNMVYDTSNVNIGRMNPGEVRAFSTRFSNFDNIDEVHRFDCVASYN